LKIAVPNPEKKLFENSLRWEFTEVHVGEGEEAKKNQNEESINLQREAELRAPDPF